MKIKYHYDSEVDAIAIEIDIKKSDITIELTEHILVDMTNDGKLAGLEILDASEELSKLFNRAVSKEEMKQLLCEIKPESANGYLLQFESPQKKQKAASVLIPLYQSPLASV
ncbi:hypothetical protein A2335_00995 [Candidatus Peregrinibacteria bacterium RIFOXYB2_FULL_32_7]|nr:MAG: hypothetical protein A2335_00995 [Candidatus Peregrinibacteria bacterium RIFOXYB2_FULL_32_7]